MIDHEIFFFFVIEKIGIEVARAYFDDGCQVSNHNPNVF